MAICGRPYMALMSKYGYPAGHQTAQLGRVCEYVYEGYALNVALGNTACEWGVHALDLGRDLDRLTSNHAGVSLPSVVYGLAAECQGSLIL